MIFRVIGVRDDVTHAIESAQFLLGNIAFAYVGFTDGPLVEFSGPVLVMRTSLAWSALP